jgi:hypothetical protein
VACWNSDLGHLVDVIVRSESLWKAVECCFSFFSVLVSWTRLNFVNAAVMHNGGLSRRIEKTRIADGLDLMLMLMLVVSRLLEATAIAYEMTSQQA